MKIDSKDYSLEELVNQTVKRIFHEQRQTAWHIEDEIDAVRRAVRRHLKGSKKSLNKLVSEENTLIARTDKPQSATPFQRVILTVIKIELKNQDVKKY